jgi:predicted aminopeptidase
MRTKALLGTAIVCLLASANLGCYLAHVSAGQMKVLWSRETVDDVIADPATPDDVRTRLELVQHVRAFAAEVGLAVDGQYTSYVPWPGDRIVTSVVATRPGEIEPATFWFPIVGSVPYRGYFDRERAAAEAARLRAEGMDVCEVRVRAYSTLGWFDDPVTGPMLRQSEGRLVGVVLHELVHATVFAPGQARFNEGLATAVGQEARVRFYARERGADAAEEQRAQVADVNAIRAELVAARDAIEALYAGSAPGAARDAQRQAIEDAARARIAALPLTTRDAAEAAERARLNDACLGLAGTYSADLDRYAALLDALGGDLPALLARADAVKDADDPVAALLGEADRPPE